MQWGGGARQVARIFENVHSILSFIPLNGKLGLIDVDPQKVVLMARATDGTTDTEVMTALVVTSIEMAR